MMMDDKRLQEIKARAEAATPGEWHAGRGDMATIVDGYESKWIYAEEGTESKYLAISSGYEIEDWNQVMANARFIAHSRTDIPDLITEVERLGAENTRLRAELEAAKGELAEAHRYIYGDCGLCAENGGANETD